MPDTEISRLTELPAALVDQEDVLAIVDVSASETKKVKATSIVVAAIDDLPPGSITGDKIDTDTLVLPDDSIGENHLKSNSVSTNKIQDGAVTDDKITAIDGSKINNGTVTDTKLAAGIDGTKLTDGTVSDSKISSLNGSKLTAGSVDNDKLATGIDGRKITDGTVSDSKITGLDGSKLTAGSVNNDKLATGIDGRKITDGTVNNDALASGIDGAKLVNGSVTANKLDPAGFSDGIELDGTVKHTNEIVPGTANGITFDAQGHVTGTGAIQATELPIATTTTVGAVSVPASSGLTVSGAGALDHADTIAPGTASKVTFNSHGHIIGTSRLVAADMPPATSTTLGAVIVPTTNDNPVRVDGLGNLTHDTSPVTPGTYVSLTVDNHGHVTDGEEVLQIGQIPDLSADNITSGQFGTNRLEDHSVTAPKLADYATCLMQEDFPGPGEFLGQFWYTPSTAQLRVYSRGSGPQNLWTPVGFGLLQQQNLRFAFTFDASTSTITSITQYGAPLDLAVGDAIPTATDQLSGAYGVCIAEGNGITLHDVNGDNFTVGDWILCGGETTGWLHIDIADGTGGGGGAQRLNDLLDVTIGGANPVGANLDPNIQPRVALQDGDILRYYSDIGQWVNAPERAGVEMGPNPPSSAPPGTMWWDTNSGRLFISYDDGNTVQWVPATPEAGGGSTGGGGGGGGAESLNGLNDVQATKTANAVLFYNDINNRWESTTTIEAANFTIDGGSF